VADEKAREKEDLAGDIVEKMVEKTDLRPSDPG
jgi:hypothetical protein